MVSSLPRTFPRRALLAGSGILLAAPAIVRAQVRNGAALVIGNSKYHWEAQLQNVRRDAPDIARRFQEIGFKTELLQDAGRSAMFDAIARFRAAAAGAELAAFYFAGHGASWDKETYLVPVDADLGNPGTVTSLLPVSAISAAMRGAARRLLVFDNCRNNPADGWRQRWAAAGSAVTSADLAATALHGPNTLLMFSTAPGRVALDGPAGENSPFAAAFLRELDGPSIDIASLPARLRRSLLLATGGRQVTWDASTYTEPYILNVRPAAGRSPRGAAAGARILEVPQAYALAREKKLALPPGLVGIRTPAGGSNDFKVGSYASTIKIKVGTSATPGTSIEPLIFIVLSVDDGGTAQTIVCSRLQGWENRGSSWGFFEGRIAKDTAEYAPYGFVQWILRWKDANTGTYEVVRAGANVYPGSDRFTRVD